MTGALIVNGFLQSQKFNEIYQMLSGAFSKRGVKLNLYTNDSFCVCLSSNFKSNLPFSDEEFIIFWDKDIILCKYLEQLGYPTFNNSLAIQLCDDKRQTAITLKNSDINTPKTIIAPKTFENVGYNKLDFISNCAKVLEYPLIIKEAFGSFGMQVYLANDFNQAKNIIEKIGGKEIIVQQFISNSKGKDIRVNVVGGKVICAIERFNPNDFRSNVTLGGSMKEIKLSKAQEEIAVKACSALNLDFAGVDILIDENGNPLVCEVNSNPHFKSTLLATGIDLAQHIANYVLKRLGKND